MNRAELKSRAKEQLQGKRGVLALVTLISLILSISINFNTNIKIDLGKIGVVLVIISIIFSILNVILQYGVTKIYLDVANYREVNIYDIFAGFNKKVLFKTIGLSILISIMSSLPALAVVIPSIILIVGLVAFTNSIISMIIIMIIMIVLIIAVELIIIFMYSQAFYILCEDNTKGVVQCMTESRELMKGHKKEYFVLGLSFIGWMLLILITCGIGALWISPYMQTTMTNYYLELKKNNLDDSIVL